MKATIPRRTFLQGSGVSLALPMLEVMRLKSGQPDPKSPGRLVFVCTTLGLHPPALWPEAAGEQYEMTEYLSLLKAHRQDFTLFSGLGHQGQSGRQPHNSEVTWLTSARGPGLDGFRNTISVDQLAAEQIGYATRFPSITLGSHLSQSQSYTRSGVMIPAETSPARLFGKLFLQGRPADIKRQKRKLSEGQSLLDQLATQRRQLQRAVSGNDNHQLEQYFDAIRKAEKEISEAQGWIEKPKPKVEQAPPTDINDRSDLIGRTRLLMNMIPLILQTDSSRVISIMIQDHQVTPKIAGVSAGHHNLSHHGQDPDKIKQLKRIEKGLIGCFGNLLTEMKSKQESGMSLLEHTSILFGSNLGNANSHDPRNLPVFLAGGGFRHGQYVSKGTEHGDQPLCNLFIRMLNQAGLPIEAFGQSTGTLTW